MSTSTQAAINSWRGSMASISDMYPSLNRCLEYYNTLSVEVVITTVQTKKKQLKKIGVFDPLLQKHLANECDCCMLLIVCNNSTNALSWGIVGRLYFSTYTAKQGCHVLGQLSLRREHGSQKRVLCFPSSLAQKLQLLRILMYFYHLSCRERHWGLGPRWNPREKGVKKK